MVPVREPVLISPAVQSVTIVFYHPGVSQAIQHENLCQAVWGWTGGRQSWLERQQFPGASQGVHIMHFSAWRQHCLLSVRMACSSQQQRNKKESESRLCARARQVSGLQQATEALKAKQLLPGA